MMVGNLAACFCGCRTSKMLHISCSQNWRKQFQGLGLVIFSNVSWQQEVPVKYWCKSLRKEENIQHWSATLWAGLGVETSVCASQYIWDLYICPWETRSGKTVDLWCFRTLWIMEIIKKLGWLMCIRAERSYLITRLSRPAEMMSRKRPGCGQAAYWIERLEFRPRPGRSVWMVGGVARWKRSEM